MDKYFIDVINYLILRKWIKYFCADWPKWELWDHLLNPWGWIKANTFPTNISKIFERIYFQIRFWGKSNFPNDVESSWEEVKSWEKQKAALKIPK